MSVRSPRWFAWGMTTLVIGATGKTGRHVAAALDDVRPVSRSSDLRFDWTDESTWQSALDGVRAIYLVPPVWTLSSPLVSAFVPRAVESGVERIVLLSAGGLGPAGGNEPALRNSGIDWTILRPTWFHQNFTEDYFHEQVLSGTVPLPEAGPGRHAFIDTRDIADVAVAALTQDGHAGNTYEISGPEGLSFREALDLIDKVSGRSTAIASVPPAAYVAAAEAGGLDTGYAEAVTYHLTAVAAGQYLSLTDTVERVLGRPARLFAAYVEENAAAWA